MYRRKASLLHLPMSMIVYTGVWVRYIAITAPERMEWVPSSEGLKPSSSSPMVEAALRSAATTSEDLISVYLACVGSKTTFTGVEALQPG